MREAPPDDLGILNQEVTACRRCSRLVDHCARLARVKRKAYRNWIYWGRPVPSFGDPAARLLVLGLAPGAHGANRTGRVFTGDSSGDFLYAALHEAGFASQARSVSADDGLRLTDCYITCAVRCAPPGNRPLAAEKAACRNYLVRELALLTRVRVVLALGRFAHDAYLDALRARGVALIKRRLAFAHGRLLQPPGGPALLCSYHPSQQNTRTGRLTADMFRDMLRCAKETVAQENA